MQSKEIQSLENIGSYNTKIRGLADELRYAKEKIKELDMEVKRE